MLAILPRARWRRFQPFLRGLAVSETPVPQLGKEELVFLLDKLSTSGEKGSGAWRVYAAKVQQEVNSYDVQDLCRIVRAVCRVDFRKRSFLNSVCRRFCSEELAELPPRFLAQLLSDLRKLRHFDAPLLERLLKFWQFDAKIKEFNNFDLSLLLIAFARSALRDEERLSSIGGALRQKLVNMESSTAAGSLYALALLDFGSDGTGAALSSTVLPRLLGEACQQELVNIAFALVALDLPQGELLSFALQRLVKQARGLEPISIHALRIIAHCVQLPQALRPKMRASMEDDEVRRRCVGALREVLTVTKDVAIGSPPMSSRLQAALERYFEELQVPHLPEQAVGPYVPDFVLPMKVAVEVDGYTHFYAFSQRMTAKSKLKRRVLEALGWGVVSLPHFQWLPMNHQERLVFLSNKISVAAGQPFSAVRKAPLEGRLRICG
ncbi:unnamed protein product [Symbiodinium sp. CCMP2592]|nr:unnamed protein product [Symbiodinium sp. CCMP2592]